MLTVDPPGTTEPVRGDGRLWQRALWIALGGAVVSVVLPMVLGGQFEPFLAMLGAPFLIAACTSKWPRVFAALVGVVCAVQLLGALPTLVDTLQHPESIRDFVPLLLFGLSAIVGVAASVPAVRRSAADHVARRLVAGAAAIFVLGLAVSSVAAFRLPHAKLRPGDIEVTARDMEFTEHSITLDAGGGTLFVTNTDPTRHTFTIDELGIDVELPADRATRFTVEGAPGNYRFYCRPHRDMTGELTLR